MPGAAMNYSRFSFAAGQRLSVEHGHGMKRKVARVPLGSRYHLVSQRDELRNPNLSGLTRSSGLRLTARNWKLELRFPGVNAHPRASVWQISKTIARNFPEKFGSPRGFDERSSGSRNFSNVAETLSESSLKFVKRRSCRCLFRKLYRPTKELGVSPAS